MNSRHTIQVDSIYRTQFSNSTMNFNDCSCELMTGICESLDLLTFTEQLERQYHTLQSSMLNQTLSNQWLEENIEPDNVLPDVYDIIRKQ